MLPSPSKTLHGESIYWVQNPSPVRQQPSSIRIIAHQPFALQFLEWHLISHRPPGPSPMSTPMTERKRRDGEFSYAVEPEKRTYERLDMSASVFTSGDQTGQCSKPVGVCWNRHIIGAIGFVRQNGKSLLLVDCSHTRACSRLKRIIVTTQTSTSGESATANSWPSPNTFSDSQAERWQKRSFPKIPTRLPIPST